MEYHNDKHQQHLVCRQFQPGIRSTEGIERIVAERTLRSDPAGPAASPAGERRQPGQQGRPSPSPPWWWRATGPADCIDQLDDGWLVDHWHAAGRHGLGASRQPTHRRLPCFRSPGLPSVAGRQTGGKQKPRNAKLCGVCRIAGNFGGAAVELWNCSGKLGAGVGLKQLLKSHARYGEQSSRLRIYPQIYPQKCTAAAPIRRPPVRINRGVAHKRLSKDGSCYGQRQTRTTARQSLGGA